MTDHAVLASRPDASIALGSAAPDESLRPFRVEFPQEALADLHRRVLSARLPERETVNDISQGVPLATIQKVAQHWATSYDWRKVEAKLNSYPQFVTAIDGLDIHFLHVRSRYENAMPLVVTHGWPGSIIEQLKIIEPLTDPTAHGGTASDAFHVVIPSMPGYGFSGKPTTTGWDAQRIARAWVVLMKRLGYERFAAQGGDWGSVVTDLMAVQSPQSLVGILTNMPGAVPVDVNTAAFTGAPPPAGLSPEEHGAYEQLKSFYTRVYYAFWMGTRPQTATGLSDSPIGLATFLLDHDARSLELIARVFDGQKEGLTRDDVLDNVTLFWLTNTGVSAARLYWENKLPFFTPKGVTVPTAVSVFPDELYATPRSWAERAYPRLMHYNKLARGGHFAAWEQPELLCAELRAAFKSLRS